MLAQAVSPSDTRLYGIVRDGWKYFLFGGASMRSVDGDQIVGPKVTGQIQSHKLARLYVNATFSLSQDRYQTNLQVGQRFGGVVMGPEVGLSGYEGSEKLRLGVLATDLRLGEISLTVRGGIVRERGDSAQDTPYIGVSATWQF